MILYDVSYAGQWICDQKVLYKAQYLRHIDTTSLILKDLICCHFIKNVYEILIVAPQSKKIFAKHEYIQHLLCTIELDVMLLRNIDKLAIR